LISEASSDGFPQHQAVVVGGAEDACERLLARLALPPLDSVEDQLAPRLRMAAEFAGHNAEFYSGNARTHSKRQIEQIAASIRMGNAAQPGSFFSRKRTCIKLVVRQVSAYPSEIGFVLPGDNLYATSSSLTYLVSAFFRRVIRHPK
jgi:hypothetical protein